MRRRLACLAAALAAAAASAQPLPRADVLDVVAFVRGAEGAAAHLRELSGLDWDARSERLVAVTDRGRMLSFAIDARNRRLDRLRLVDAVQIRIEPRANAESVVVRGEQRWVADESRQRVLEVDGQGRVLGEHALPGALSDGAALRSSNSGVEALAHHERYGLVAVTQRPRADDPPGMHVVHAGDATRRHIAMQPGGRSTLKAADLRGNRLRLLEKLDPDVPGAPLRFVLRELDLARACDAAAPCPGPAWELDDPRLAGHNLEGLACLDDEYCVLVSDSAGPSAARPTLFVLVRLPAVPRR